MSTSSVTIAPLQWAQLKDIEDVEPLGDADTACLLDILSVLSKHGMAERFGVALLHSHFEMSEDEVLMEETDKESRTLISRAVKQSEAGGSGVPTVWMLREGDATVSIRCRSYCWKTLLGHSIRHRQK